MTRRPRPSPPLPRISNQLSSAAKGNNNNNGPGLVSSLFQGASFGAGGELGRRAVRSVLGDGVSADAAMVPQNHDNYCHELLQSMLKACSKQDGHICSSISKLYEATCLGNNPNFANVQE